MGSFEVKDRYYNEAKRLGYRARSVFKLMELDERFHIFRAGQRVLDLGAAPGSWLQYAVQKVGQGGMVLGVDLQEIKREHDWDNVVIEMGDILDVASIMTMVADYELTGFEVVVADLAPKMSGIRYVDQALSGDLGRAVVEIADLLLVRGGVVVFKIFRGPEFERVLGECRKKYRLKVWRPRAVRTSSGEVYVVGVKI